MDWTREEVTLIVSDYFDMLQQELSKEKYNKTSHRNIIIPKLIDRSNGSVEFKHQNISAVLANNGIPFIKGYKPRFKYQQLLEEEVLDFLAKNKNILEPEFDSFSNDVSTKKPLEKIDFENFLDEDLGSSSVVNESEPDFRPIKTNFLEKEQNNRTLGEQGEGLIIQFEKWRLIKAGKDSLADKIEWISKDLGDGTGFDILSKNNNGTDRFIEVKTTKLTKETPIYLSRNEWKFAQLKDKDFFLYRVFNFAANPQLFIKQGHYESFCRLQPQSFKGYF
ncbi:MAG: DUF3883 domain-containing protein [Ferruginibacter sp.]